MFNKALPTKILSYLIGIFTHQTYLVSKHFISSSERVITSSEGVKGSSERVITSSEGVIASSEGVKGSSERVITSSERVITSSERVKGSSERVITSSERVKGSSERVIVRNAEKGSISQTVKYYLQRFNLFGLGNQK